MVNSNKLAVRKSFENSSCKIASAKGKDTCFELINELPKTEF
jgi:hypothetical protein